MNVSKLFIWSSDKKKRRPERPPFLLWYEIILKLFVTTDSCDTRKDFTFDSFKQSTTTSRDV